MVQKKRRNKWSTCLQSIESFHSTFGFVRDHSTYDFEQTLAGTTEVVRSLRRLGVHSLPQIVEHLQLVTVEVTRDADALTSHHHHTLAGEDLFRDDRGETAHQMSRSINDNHFLETHIGVVWKNYFYVLLKIKHLLLQEINMTNFSNTSQYRRYNMFLL